MEKATLNKKKMNWKDERKEQSEKSNSNRMMRKKNQRTKINWQE